MTKTRIRGAKQDTRPDDTFVIIDDKQASVNRMPDGTRVIDDGDKGDFSRLKARIARMEHALQTLRDKGQLKIWCTTKFNELEERDMKTIQITELAWEELQANGTKKLEWDGAAISIKFKEASFRKTDKLLARIRRLEAQETEWRKYFNAVLSILGSSQGELNTTHDDIIEAFTNTARLELNLEDNLEYWEDKL